MHRPSHGIGLALSLPVLSVLLSALPARAQIESEGDDVQTIQPRPGTTGPVFLPPAPLPQGIGGPLNPNLVSGQPLMASLPRLHLAARLEALNQGNLGSFVQDGIPDFLRETVLRLPAGPIGGRPTDLQAGVTWQPDAGTRWNVVWESTQQLREPMTNLDLIAVAAQRQQARIEARTARDPRPVSLLREASLHLIDPDGRGHWQFGQFAVPFGQQGWQTVEPPMGLSAAETAATDALAAAGWGTVQPFAMVRRLDIGTALEVRTGNSVSTVGLFNGTGPQRLDDDQAKDLLLRTTWTDGASDSVGISYLAGEGRPLLAGSPLNPAWGPVTPKRMYGVHLTLGLGPAMLRGEWCSRADLAEASPGSRQGWAVEASLPGRQGEATYAQWAEANSPDTPMGQYQGRTWTIGLRNRLAPGTFWRAEFSDRRELLGGLVLEQQRTLTSIDWAW
ncbi:MAG: hypothetical protein VKO64_00010 [Candidatus Sericytochromatia bacterium]|nr:hypothetical protein [Candidatus Sericytochromatia bacterium]